MTTGNLKPSSVQEGAETMSARATDNVLALKSNPGAAAATGTRQRVSPLSAITGPRAAGLWILLLLATILVLICYATPRIPQPLSYHLFADRRSLLGVSNFGDVASNLPFAIVGIWGLVFLRQSRLKNSKVFLDRREIWPYAFAFAGLLLTAFGSSYYHLAPSNARLVWDRLPMTITFMSMVAAVVTERMNVRLGLRLMPILLLVGLASVCQWYWSEIRGTGDLRFYAAVQVYSALVILLASFLPRRYTRNSDLALVFGFYALAKALEFFDTQVFSVLHVVSGHTLKHIAAAAAGFCILRMLQRRRPLTAFDSHNLCFNGAQRSCLTTNRS
jgi:hypothetical protein